MTSISSIPVNDEEARKQRLSGAAAFDRLVESNMTLGKHVERLVRTCYGVIIAQVLVLFGLLFACYVLWTALREPRCLAFDSRISHLRLGSSRPADTSSSCDGATAKETSVLSRVTSSRLER